jgi:hypothetical protein
MKCDTSRIKGWEKPNLMCNVMEKASKVKHKKMVIGRVHNQASTFGPAHNFKCIWCESKGKLEMMLVKEWSCNLFKILF